MSYCLLHNIPEATHQKLVLLLGQQLDLQGVPVSQPPTPDSDTDSELEPIGTDMPAGMGGDDGKVHKQRQKRVQDAGGTKAYVRAQLTELTRMALTATMRVTHQRFLVRLRQRLGEDSLLTAELAAGARSIMEEAAVDMASSGGFGRALEGGGAGAGEGPDPGGPLTGLYQQLKFLEQAVGEGELGVLTTAAEPAPVRATPSVPVPLSVPVPIPLTPKGGDRPSHAARSKKEKPALSEQTILSNAWKELDALRNELYEIQDLQERAKKRKQNPVSDIARKVRASTSQVSKEQASGEAEKDKGAEQRDSSDKTDRASEGTGDEWTDMESEEETVAAPCTPLPPAAPATPVPTLVTSTPVCRAPCSGDSDGGFLLESALSALEEQGMLAPANGEHSAAMDEVEHVLSEARDAFRDVKHVFEVQDAFKDVRHAFKEVRRAYRGHEPGPRTLPPCADATAIDVAGAEAIGLLPPEPVPLLLPSLPPPSAGTGDTEDEWVSAEMLCAACQERMDRATEAQTNCVGCQTAGPSLEAAPTAEQGSQTVSTGAVLYLQMLSDE